MEGTSDITSVPNYSDEKSEIPAQQISNVSLNINSTENIKINPISQMLFLRMLHLLSNIMKLLQFTKSHNWSNSTSRSQYFSKYREYYYRRCGKIKLYTKNRNETEKYIDNTITTDEVINYNNSEKDRKF